MSAVLQTLRDLDEQCVIRIHQRVAVGRAAVDRTKWIVVQAAGEVRFRAQEKLTAAIQPQTRPAEGTEDTEISAGVVVLSLEQWRSILRAAAAADERSRNGL